MDYIQFSKKWGDAMYITPREEDVKKIREEGMYVIFVNKKGGLNDAKGIYDKRNMCKT